MSFVKPNAVKLDTRAQDEKDRELAERTSANLFHIQKQLVAKGHSLEEILCVTAKHVLGVNVAPHAPAPKPETKAA